MSMVRMLCVVAGLVVAGCSTATQGGQKTSDISTKPIPPEFAEQVQLAELLGRAIYQKDILAARATDAMLALGSPALDAKIGGWVTVSDGGKWVVYFFDRSRGSPAIFKEVNFPDSTGKSPKVGESGPRPALEKTAVAMFRARGSAVKMRFQKCSQTYNSVVLPADMAGEKGWYVYLLAATTKRDEAVMGGHVRVHVSADGTEIMNVKAFTKSCITMPIDRDAAGLLVSHIVDNHPVETHVYMSLLYGMPLVVVISPRNWLIQKGAIGLTDLK